MYQLVFANNRNISHAAGEFLHKKLLTEDLEEVLKEHRAQRHTRKIREPHIILKELLRFFLENEVRIAPNSRYCIRCIHFIVLCCKAFSLGFPRFKENR